ncbi:MAG: hypothetical protein ACI4DY_12860, partial [Monoglobaceae bacterium]
MKMKRFVAVFVAVMMVLGTMAAVPAFAEGEVASYTMDDGSTGTSTTLSEALTNVKEGGTVTLLSD